MKILDVSPRVTTNPTLGSSVRTYNLLLRLSRRHEIRQFSQSRLSAFASGPADVWVTPRYQEHQSPNLIARLITEVSERAWVRAPVLSGVALRATRPKRLLEWLRWSDLTLVEFPWQLAECRRLHPEGRFFLSALNVELPKFESYARASGVTPRNRGWLSLIEHLECRAVAIAERILVVSQEDGEEFVRRYGVDPGRIALVPNGADTEKFRPAGPEGRRAARRALGLPERPTVLFIGNDVPPNRAGLSWVRRVAARAPRYTFLILGSVCPPERHGNLVAAGCVEEVAPYFDAADAALCPIEHGGGTKIKLLESMSSGLPTVAFEESIHGLAARDGHHLLVAEKSDKSLVEALDRLLEQPELASRLGNAAAALVRRDYDWDSIAETLEGILTEAISHPPGHMLSF